jgi:hypothetical protein
MKAESETWLLLNTVAYVCIALIYSLSNISESNCNYTKQLYTLAAQYTVRMVNTDRFSEQC